MAPQHTQNAAAEQQGKGWFTPVRLLCLFCAMNMLVYLDRGMFAPSWASACKASMSFGVEYYFSLIQELPTCRCHLQ